MAEADQYDTILRPRGGVTGGALLLDGESGPAGAGGTADDPIGDMADDRDTLVPDPAVPAPSEADDEVDDSVEDEPHPTEALRFGISIGTERLVLDEDVHIGRNPRPPRQDSGRPVRLLRVGSPTGVVSSSHLGLRRVGSTAVAADLRSTNGTVVYLPGFPPRRLRQGESVVAPPGTRLEIGEGIVIEVMRPETLG